MAEAEPYRPPAPRPPVTRPPTTRPPAPRPPKTVQLSADARALLAELGNDADTLNTAQSAAMILVPPHNDPKAAAFAEWLNRLEDDGAATTAHEASDAHEVSDAHEAHEAVAHKATEAFRAEFAATETAKMGRRPDDESPDDFDLDDFDDADSDKEPDEQIGQPGGLFSLLKRGRGGAAHRLVGAKDAMAAYNAQSGRSLWPFTTLRAVLLVFVAAVPPLVHLIVIQPQISDNNRKITETRNFEAKSQEDEKIADKLAHNISSVERRSARLLETLMPEEKLAGLVNGFIAALQRYGMELQSYNVSADKSRKVVIGDLVQDARVLEINLLGRYDVYSEIRRVFVEQSKTVTVLDEQLQAAPGQIDLTVKARLMVPVRRAYDKEVDVAFEAGKK